jgi:hypothetical protein
VETRDLDYKVSLDNQGSIVSGTILAKGVSGEGDIR